MSKGAESESLLSPAATGLSDLDLSIERQRAELQQERERLKARRSSIKARRSAPAAVIGETLRLLEVDGGRIDGGSAAGNAAGSSSSSDIKGNDDAQTASLGGGGRGVGLGLQVGARRNTLASWSRPGLGLGLAVSRDSFAPGAGVGDEELD